MGKAPKKTAKTKPCLAEQKSYDAIGNPTSYYDGTAFTWVHGRRLASAVNSSTGLNNTYTYDADGLRLTKKVNGVVHKYLWQGGRLVSESWDGKVLEFFYGPDGSPESLYYLPSGATEPYRYFFVKNLQGDVMALINKDGDVKAQYTYDPYGKVLTATGTLADLNPIRYRGYYYDTETGFYYLQSRYYDPNLCRFINADGLASTGQGFLGCNMFAYCGNNPVCFADPNGEMPWYLDPNGEGHFAKMQVYRSADEAAIAFSEEIYGISYYVMIEYSTEIYYIEANGSKRYYYTKPAVGSPHGSSGINTNHVPSHGVQVAYAHTHPHSNTFSKPDYNYADRYSIDAYVIGPNLWVQKYDYLGNEVTNVAKATIREFGVIQPDRLNFFRSIWEGHFDNGKCPDGLNCIITNWPNS